MKTEAVLLVVILRVWGLSISAHADPWRGVLGQNRVSSLCPLR